MVIGPWSTFAKQGDFFKETLDTCTAQLYTYNCVKSKCMIISIQASITGSSNYHEIYTFYKQGK